MISGWFLLTIGLVQAPVRAQPAAFVQHKWKIDGLHTIRQQALDLALFNRGVFANDAAVRTVSAVSWWCWRLTA